MTDRSILASQEATSFEERIEILAKELELAVKWQCPCVMFVVYQSEYVRAEVEAALENCLIDLGQKAAHLNIKNKETTDIFPHLQGVNQAENTVYFIKGLHWGHGKETSVYAMLNLQKEIFVEKQIRAIFWLTQSEIKDLAHCAPDFWVFRHRAIEFVESPTAHRILQEALNSAWQGTGEYEDQFEDTDAKISLRESMLLELPKGEEASSIRANLLLTLGVLNWRKGDFEKADQQLQDTLKLAAKIQDAWFEAECFNAVALVKTSMGRIDESIDAYKHAIQLAPDQIFAWNNLGNLCAKIGRNDEAITAFQKAIECNPRDPVGWNGLGDVYNNNGSIDDAIAAYRKSIQFMPTFAHPWNGLGNVYAGSGRVDEAIEAYHKAIDLNGKYVTPWLQLAKLFCKQDRYREAIKAYQRALSLDSNNSAIWNELGIIYNKLESYEQAEEIFLKAIELDHGNGWAYSNLGYTYTRLGKCKESVSLFLRSIELVEEDRDKAVAWDRLGESYQQLNDYDNAIAAFQTADMLEIGSAVRTNDDTAREPELPSSILYSDIHALVDFNEATKPQLHSPATNSSAFSSEPNTTVPEQTAEQVFSDTPYWIFDPKAEVESRTEPMDGQSQDAQAGAASADINERATPDLPSSNLPDHTEMQSSEDLDALTVVDDIRAESTNASVWNEKGNDYFKRGAIEEAINAYIKSIQFDTEFGWPYSNLALAYHSQGKSTEAILLYQRSIELLDSNKDKAVSWNGLGNVYRRINDYANAIAAYQKAAELDPETAGMRDGVGNFQTGLDSGNARVWNEMGEHFFKTGEYEEAKHAFDKAIGLEPKSGWPYSNLARAFAAQGKYAEAIPLYQKSIDLLLDEKDKAVSWNRLGNVYRKLNNYDQAAQAYQKAVSLTDEDAALITRTRFSLLGNLAVD
jgi:tetratricopeptide (TPR) repeat protein